MNTFLFSIIAEGVGTRSAKVSQCYKTRRTVKARVMAFGDQAVRRHIDITLKVEIQSSRP